MIDILMATYNGEPYIEAQMASIFSQNYTHWKLYIQDDRSNDQTVKCAKKMAYKYEMAHAGQQAGSIQIHINEYAGGSACKNFMKLLEYASSEYVMFCDQDDVWHEDKIRKTLKLMKKAEKAHGRSTPILVYSDLRVVDADLEELAPSFIDYMKLPPKIRLPRLLMQNSVAGCTVMMNQALYQMLRRMPYSENVVMHDHLAALLAKTCGKILFLPEATMDYRQHTGNSVGASNANSIIYNWQRLRRGKKQFQKDMYKAMDQAGAFLQIYGEDMKRAKDKQLMKAFADLRSANKFKRIHFYIKNRVIKYGLVRAVMQLIWS